LGLSDILARFGFTLKLLFARTRSNGELADIRNKRSNFEQWKDAAKLFKLENVTAAFPSC